MIDTLALMTGIDVPIPEIQVILHQPTCKEIALISRQSYVSGTECLCLNKANFSQDKSLLKDTSTFQIFMTIMTDEAMKDKREDVIKTLQLFFPQYSVKVLPRSIGLFHLETKEMKIVDDQNFEILQEYIKDVLCISKDKDSFNPQGDKAKEIAAKLERGRQRIAAQKKGDGSGDTFTQYISVITVAIPSMSLQEAMNLTMFQIRDLVERYALHSAWDIDIRSRMAGAKNDKPPEDWMKDIH